MSEDVFDEGDGYVVDITKGPPQHFVTITRLARNRVLRDHKHAGYMPLLGRSLLSAIS